MMTTPSSPAAPLDPAAFLSRLEARGVALWLDEAGCLRYRAPAGTITPAVAARIKKARPRLLPLLREQEQAKGGPDEPDELLRESYLIASARLGALPENLPAPLRLPSGRVAANVNAFVRGSVERWRHAQAKPDPDALAFAGTTWRDVAEQEAADLDACAARFAADPRDFDTDVLANAHEWFEANAQKEQNDER